MKSKSLIAAAVLAALTAHAQVYDRDGWSARAWRARRRSNLH
jgi:hypothetical protein